MTLLADQPVLPLGLTPRRCSVCGRKVDRLQGSPGSGAGVAHIVVCYPCGCWLGPREAHRITRERP